MFIYVSFLPITRASAHRSVGMSNAIVNRRVQLAVEVIVKLAPSVRPVVNVSDCGNALASTKKRYCRMVAMSIHLFQ